jgi:hypothetical protein
MPFKLENWRFEKRPCSQILLHFQLLRFVFVSNFSHNIALKEPQESEFLYKSAKKSIKKTSFHTIFGCTHGTAYDICMRICGGVDVVAQESKSIKAQRNTYPGMPPLSM